MKKRIVSLLMALALCLSLLPTSALAETVEETPPQEAAQQQDEPTEPIQQDEEQAAPEGETEEDKDEAEEEAEGNSEEETEEEITEETKDENEPTSAMQMALSNDIVLLADEPHSHPICGAKCNHSGDSKHDNVEWKGVSSLDSATITEGTAGKPNYYYLTKTVTLSSTWYVPDNVVLCLNGNTITCKAAATAITVSSNSSFTLTDCKSDGKITHGTFNYTKINGRGVQVVGTFNMYGGSISGNTYDNSGGVDVNGGTFNMYNGTISGNKASGTKSGTGGNGGGVSVSGTFNMSGGTIKENSAVRSGGGVLVGSSGKFNMSGSAKITDNKANGAYSAGGGVYVDGGTFTMTGGSISSNEANEGKDSTYGNVGGSGGGVYVGGGTFNMSGSASISGNKANGNHDYGNGGGVWVNSNGTFNMNGGTIGGANASNANTASFYGGGVWVNSNGTFNMNGGTIKNNSATEEGYGSGGGVFVLGNGTFTMSDGTITENNVSEDGGGVFVDAAGTFKVSGAVTITGNTKGSSSSENNVFLSYSSTSGNNAIITIAGKLTNTTPIGVTLASGHNGVFTSGWTDKMKDNAGNVIAPTGYFTHDGKRYDAALGNGEVALKAHQHTWTYTASGATITAKCVGCFTTGGSDFDGGSVTIKAPEKTVYRDNKNAGATTKKSNNWKGGAISPITYTTGSTTSTTAPTNAGTYTASITVGDQTASVTYTIGKAAQAITVLSDKSIIKNGKGVSISDWASVAGITGGTEPGALTYKLKDSYAGVTLENGTLTATSAAAAGTITITVTAAETDNYNEASKDFNVTVKAKDAKDLAVSMGNWTYGGNAASVTYQKPDGTTSETITYAQKNADGTFTALTEVPSNAGTYKVTVVCETDNKVYTGEATFTIAPKTLKASDLEYTGSITKVYDGTTSAPTDLKVSVKSSSLANGDALIIDGTLTYNSANVGEANTITFTPVAITTGNYQLAASEVLTISGASITQRTVSDPTIVVAAAGAYTGEEKRPSVTISDNGTTIPTDEYTVVYSNNINAGAGTVTIKNKDGGNYVITERSVNFGIDKASAPTLTDVTFTQKYTDKASHTLTLPDLTTLGMPANAGVPEQNAFHSGSCTEGLDYLESNSLECDVNTGALTYTLSDTAEANKTIKFTIMVRSLNYEDATLNVVVTLTARDDQPNFKFAEATKTVIYGDADFTVTATGQESGSTVTYASSDTTVATVNSTTGKVTIVGAGETTITATAGETTDYNTATASYKLTVSRRTIKVKADDKSMTVNGKLPEFTVSYENLGNAKAEDIFKPLPTASTTADGKTAGTFDITVTVGEFDGKNYEVQTVPGKLTVTKQSSGYYYKNPTASGTADAEKSPRTGDAGLLVYGLTALTGYTGTALVLRRRKRED